MATFDAHDDRAQDADSDHSLLTMNKTPATPIAIIGMACRLPGGIESPDQLWEALLRGDDLVTEIPPDRWDADEYYDPEPGVHGRSACKWGAFLDDVAGFDPAFFGISEREATLDGGVLPGQSNRPGIRYPLCRGGEIRLCPGGRGLRCGGPATRCCSGLIAMRAK